MTQKEDVYIRITQKIISDLEKGELTWRKPWSSENLADHVMRPLRWNDKPYTGINTVMLWATAAEQGYLSPYWMTFKQATEMKARIKKGEKATTVVYADMIEKEFTDGEGKTELQKIPFLKQYSVFNANQIEGLSEAYYATPAPNATNPEQRVEQLEQFFANTKARIITGTEAVYYLSGDKIEMPPFECFNNAAAYYSTLAHEITHWTRHPTRLNRDFNRKKWGDEGYAKEELVAELGSCFLAADLGIAPIPQEQHSAYIQSWLKVLKDDKRFIIQAAAFANKAAEYLASLQQAESKTLSNTPQISNVPALV
jgi:antirestriction protein ArdC